MDFLCQLALSFLRAFSPIGENGLIVEKGCIIFRVYAIFTKR